MLLGLVLAADNPRVLARPGRGAIVFSNHRAQRFAVESQVCDELLQPAILVLDLFQPLRFTDAQPGEPRSPRVKGRCADLMLAANINDSPSLLTFFQNRENLIFAESGFAHDHSSSTGELLVIELLLFQASHSECQREAVLCARAIRAMMMFFSVRSRTLCKQE
ncbi:MAG TPA: hypothetical protein VKB47_14155 [Terracidiphilus sp.]|nr:hypothetical protein [Terracidiphilus sp.]